jgi:glutathione synthase/RimK-type ligase-like ATP-grasp enzyme
MIVALYGKAAEPYVGGIIADLQATAAARGAEIFALALETALRGHRQWDSVERLYLLPFDVPATAPAELPLATPQLIKTLFPRADPLNSPAVHELCWDKLVMARTLLDRGVPMPETLITNDPDEAAEFVRRHEQAILKEPRGCGGHGHVVLFADESGTIGGEVPGRRYAVELVASAIGRSLAHGVLTCPPPFYLQRLVTDTRRTGVLTPAQIVRAYVVDGQAVFWTERYRDRVRRPADFIVTTAFGARYRFLPEVSDAAKTIARRAAEALGVRVGVVDLIRSGSAGPYVLDVDTDGQHMVIDRSFKQLPEFRDPYDFDRYIAELLLAPPPLPPARRPRPPQLRKEPPAARRSRESRSRRNRS